MSKNIFVAGHLGMVGSALCRRLIRDEQTTLLTRNRADLDLTNQQAVRDFFDNNRIHEVYLAAAKVGGIHANSHYPGEFLFDNLLIQSNIIDAAYKAGVEKLLFLGSSCIYPKHAPQPMAETSLLTGGLEPTNEPYAIAKIAGIKLCESYNRQYGVDYRSVMPTNLYGENDNFHPENSHVIPAMMRRVHQAKLTGQTSVTIWGTGKPKREFLHVDDMAAASVYVMNLSNEQYDKTVEQRCSHINVGTGIDCSIRTLAETMCRVVGFEGELMFDVSKPDGAPRKLLDVTRLNKLGWKASIELEHGLAKTYEWFLTNETQLRGVS